MALEKYLAIARGNEAADFCLKQARVVNVFSGEIEERDIYVARGKIIGFSPREAREEIDLAGAYVLPGFIDAHLHIESSYLTPVELAKILLPCGTTCAICDPHEIANVAGLEGVKYFLREAQKVPFSFYFTAPSCVPASPLETAGAVLGPDEVAWLLKQPQVIGLAEVMNFPGTIAGEPNLLAKIRITKALGKHIDGHAPGLSGLGLEAYRLAGPANDHETISLEEAKEKLALGFTVFIRRGTVANNLGDLLPLVSENNWPFFTLVSDDVNAKEILEKGHLNRVLGEVVDLGLSPITAVRLVTISPARHYHLLDRGGIFPGARADLVVVKDLERFEVQAVWSAGRLVAKEGRLCEKIPRPEEAFARPFSLPRDLDLRVPVQGERLRVIGLIPGQIVTEHLILEPTVKDGLVVADPARDLAKIVCIERHHDTGRYTVGFVQGFGLKSGALASTVAHDSHHLLVVGMNDEDILLAAKELARLGGGQVVVDKGQIMATLPLPVAGLMSTLSANEVAERLEALHQAAKALGCLLPEPFMSLSFLALPVIPYLKITDQGLVDVERFEFVSLMD